MFVKNYGLFWRADEVDWSPGQGARGAFRLLGRRSKNIPTLRLADFRHQIGIYILYGNHGPIYVGLTKEQGLGKRLKDHLTDELGGQWDRFSWFGFRIVLKGRDDNGLCELRKLAEVGIGKPQELIGDVEALLIKAMGLNNIKQMKFSDADEWFQVKAYEVDKYMEKVIR
jgi:hypothetical protein